MFFKSAKSDGNIAAQAAYAETYLLVCLEDSPEGGNLFSLGAEKGLEF